MNLAQPLREAILNNVEITDALGTYMGEPSVFTRRPLPDGATYPMVAISPDISIRDADALVTQRPIIQRDVTVYGQIGPAGSETDHYRVVETLAYAVREMFHRRKQVLFVDDYHVVDIVASGPIPAPTESERLIGRVVSLTIRLHRNP